MASPHAATFKELGTLAARILAEQFGADRSAADWRSSAACPDLRIASRSTATLKVSTRSRAYTVTPANHSVPPKPSAPGWSLSRERPSRSTQPHVFGSQPDIQAVPLQLRSRASACRHATKADPPPLIWPSASPLAPRVGPNPKLHPLFCATISRAIKAYLASSLAFAEPLPKQCVGLLRAGNRPRPLPRNLRRSATVASLEPHAVSAPMVAPALRAAGRRSLFLHVPSIPNGHTTKARLA